MRDEPAFCEARRKKMENKKIDVLFGLTVIAFLVVTFILINEFNSRRAEDYKDYIGTVTNLVKLKNEKIRVLARHLAEDQKVIQDLRNTLANTRDELDTLNKKFVQQAPAAAAQAPVAPPAVAAVAPAAAK